ncbi:TOPRIM nucleotidyl transferase/hydrolase domain-containing protein [Agromyces aurantiacus]|uniref:TOPRIM nucleotidyl transferase/hydrolase domain-containing protein n=1 Tax=Agromyces aurantiacus TaxID=165814 RepID=A0ABV9R3K6_9MICO|nr:TOPRIM nucleotidyl transferase/hydrolase domain-containing protein [Agromyces aurantiacus]MBM7502700.1 hypothetical protein [Agromyces aurantiacus]
MRDARAATDRVVLLVEGPSDHRAILALAARLGVDLGGGGVRVVDMGGVTNLRTHLAELDAAFAGPVVDPPRLLGLYDVGEFEVVCRMLEESGRGRPADLAEAEALGFFACALDLEDELIRAAGADLVQSMLAEAGELSRFRTFQGQPAQRGRPIEAQLRRFAGTASGRKVRFAAAIVERMPLERVPRQLADLLRAAAP